MVASNYDRDREAENILVLPRFELRVLKSGLVYGANPRNAQLIFNTHDTNLLSAGIFRRDQIWFTEKNRYGEAMLYSLGDFKTSEVRKEDNFEKNYIQGKYGAIPFLGDFQQLLTQMYRYLPMKNKLREQIENKQRHKEEIRRSEWNRTLSGKRLSGWKSL